MDEDLLSLLKTSKTFSSLDEAVLKKLLPKFRRIELETDDILFHQGDPSNAIFVLASGKLGVFMTTHENTSRLFNYIEEAGETIGEPGAFTHEPRPLTIKVLKKSVLYQLSNHDFIDLCHRYPNMTFSVITPILLRTGSLFDMLNSEKMNKHVAVVPANLDMPLESFLRKLTAYLENEKHILVLSEYQETFQSEIDIQSLREKINAHIKNKSTHKIIYILKSYDSPLATLSLKKADSLYIAAYHHAIPKIDQFILDKLHSRRLHHKHLPELILVYTERMMTPSNTIKWLHLTSFEINHHLRIDVLKDYQRLSRFLRGKAYGLVLGGGGTRGWAHLGVIKALREKNIPIDMLGGTSVGAIVGACYAIHESFEDACERFNIIVEASRGSASWRTITWPAISLFNAKGFTRSLMDVFKLLTIENVSLPFFCISSNLSTSHEDVHRTGLIWEKTRASASIPGIIPPMVLNGELHLDGGLLNNLPVDTMRHILGKKAKIIAVELNSFEKDHHQYQFPPIITFWQGLFAKLNPGDKYRFPRFTDTFMRGLLMSSLARTAQNTLMANLLINLDLHKFRMLHASKFQAEKLIEIGYETTLKQLEERKNI